MIHPTEVIQWLDSVIKPLSTTIRMGQMPSALKEHEARLRAFKDTKAWIEQLMNERLEEMRKTISPNRDKQ